MIHLHLTVGRHAEAIFFIGYFHPMTLLSTPLRALTRFFRILCQHLYRVLVGINQFIHLSLAIINGIPELMCATFQVHVHIAILHLPGIPATYAKGTLIILLSTLCADTECQHQGKQHQWYFSCFHCYSCFTFFQISRQSLHQRP